MNCDFDWYTDIGERIENEDTVQVRLFGQNLVAVLSDGLGGQGDGKAASLLVCDGLMQCGSDGVFPSREATADTFMRTNAALIAQQKNAFHMKSTAVYLCLQGDQAIWAHMGDSRLYHFHQGQLCSCTLDHSAAQLAVFLGSLRREDIPKDPGRNRLVRAMGTADDVPDIQGPVRLKPGRHAFLLCSDGLWEYLSDQEITLAVTRCENASAGISILRQRRAEKSAAGCDNHSAILIFLEVRVQKHEI